MASLYKLRSNILGHKGDVRAIASTIFPEGGFVTGSRDRTARIWAPNGFNQGFGQTLQLTGHQSYVTSVCVIPPCEKYPQGRIATGGHDSTILMYQPNSTEPICTLTGHKDNVCALTSGKFGFLISGSWDKTARVWLNEKSVMTLEGHQAAVWAVALISDLGIMLTGSADRTIKVWKTGKCQHTFSGHGDCVRGLATLSSEEFLSCSNDATIRRWSLTSMNCLQVYYGHQNFIYNLALLPNGQDFVSVSEDRTLKVWRGGECRQTISHPAESLWCVCTLANGDILTGASDGVVRAFTCAKERMANEEEQRLYDECVAAQTIPTNVGDIDVNKLADKSSLSEPGTKEGQTKMVRSGDKVELYSWDSAMKAWNKVGDVVGSSGGSQRTSGKMLHEGKEYDYVFSIDVEDGKPPLKLPYNITEDPWMAAQKFLHANSLPQPYLDQVANFIVENTKGVTLGTQAAPYADPFTGGDRYVPGSGAARGDGQHQAKFGADPFTGDGSYKPQGNASVNPFFPQNNFVTFEQANASKIIDKLKELNQGVEQRLQVSPSQIDSLQPLVGGQRPSTEQLATLKRLMDWPPASVFPVLDVLRMVIRGGHVTPVMSAFPGLLELLRQLASPDSTPQNQLVTMWTLANLFGSAEGVALCLDHQQQVLEAAVGCVKSSNLKVLRGAGAVLLNFAVALLGKDDLDKKAECLQAAELLLQGCRDGEAAFRVLVALGTLMYADPTARAAAMSLGMGDLIQPFVGFEEQRVAECAKACLAEYNSS